MESSSSTTSRRGGTAAMLPPGPRRPAGVAGTSSDRKAGPRRISTSAGDAGAVNSSRPPADFTELVDQRRGSVRASGRLTPQAADLLRGTVLALHGDGHPRVVIDLGGVDAADEAA